MNAIETLKRDLDGLDAFPRLLDYAAHDTPVAEIPEDDLQRMKWFGVFHRPQKPGTFMMRLRLSGGMVTAPQLRVLAGIAEAHGGQADITSRQNIQLRELTLPKIPAILRDLAAAGIAANQTGLDNVRTIMGCPVAGLDRGELFDATPVVRALSEAHRRAGKEFSNLPRKFNVSVSGCREDCADAQTQDLGLVPASRTIHGRREIGFNALVGGALGGTSPRLATPLDVFLTREQAVPFFLALLRVFRDNGAREVRTKARLKWLIEEWGEERLRCAVEVEMGATLPRAGCDERATPAGNHLGVHPQRHAESSYVGLHVPVGRISSDEMEQLAALSERYGSGEVRLTIEQNVIIVNVPDSRVAELRTEPLLAKLRPDPSPVWRNLVACTGNDYCHYSLIDTKQAAVDLARTLEAREVRIAEGTRIHLSGCVHACGKHHVGDIGMQGQNVREGTQIIEAVDIFTGGRSGPHARLAERVARKVPLRDLADTLANLLPEAETAVPAPRSLSAGAAAGVRSQAPAAGAMAPAASAAGGQ